MKRIGRLTPCTSRGIERMRWPWLLILAAGLGACLGNPVAENSDCALGRTTTTDPLVVPACLHIQGIISVQDRDSAVTTLQSALQLRDVYTRNDSSSIDFNKRADLTRSVARVGEFYARGLFGDSARFHRLMDHVRVTMEYVQGPTYLSTTTTILWPVRTPYLAWSYYFYIGIFFQPVTTALAVVDVLPRANAPTDSITGISRRLYAYALWRRWGTTHFPVWEYEFPWTSGGVSVDAPWVSGMAQGMALLLFTESYRRTLDPNWLVRAQEVLRSFQVTWDHGGVLLPDTMTGYWWEEYHPVVRVWNGSVQALIAVGYYAQVTGDQTASRMFDRGIESLKYWTPRYDSGYWTYYSLTQGFNTKAYHAFCIRLLDLLYTLKADPWIKATADRWRSYTAPPGVP